MFQSIPAGHCVAHLSAAILASAIFVAGHSHTARATESWVQDPITGCTVWTPSAEEGEIVSWSGACVDGKANGPGVLVWIYGGKLVARYGGTLNGGKAEGFGDLHFLEAEGYVHYVGEFKDGMLHGRGQAVLPDGASFEGEFRADHPHGAGTFEGADGSFYQGDYVDGQRHGVGAALGADGDYYKGEFRDGVRSGTGTLIDGDGNVYQGAFENGEPNGAGIWRLVGGGLYDGPVKNGKAEGRGMFTAANGDVYEGTFIDNQPSGTFAVTRADGTRVEQLWRDGKLVE